MPFDGNGNWTSNYNAEADRDANIKILASRFDNILLADLAQSFENCLTKDTQIKPQTNFNANNYRVINVADPTSDKDAVNKQTLESTVSSSISTLLATLYPVGSLYIGTQSTCPLSSLIDGSTWVKVEGRYLLASGTLAGTSEQYDVKSEVNAGLPNITASADVAQGQGYDYRASGAFYKTTDGAGGNWDTAAACKLNLDASRSSSIYGASSTVRAPAYAVNVWRRTA